MSSQNPSSETLPPMLATEAVLQPSCSMPDDAETVRGYDFNHGVNYHELLTSYARSGFQATSFGRAVVEINRMIECKKQPVPEADQEKANLNPYNRDPTNCTIFLSYTSNLISAGVREVLRYLVQNNMDDIGYSDIGFNRFIIKRANTALCSGLEVDCLVTTAGGVEEDFIKCLASTYIGDFHLSGKELRMKGINRIGNLLVPNDNYCKFEDWIIPIFDEMLHEQKEEGTKWTPSRVIHRLGKEIDHPDSVYYWAYKHNIPVFCPALTDGSLGDMLYFHSYKNPGLIIDLVEDIRLLNNLAVYSVNSGMIILGGGVIKHHTCNANLMRNGADFSVFVNTASEYDGSDSGARPDEAVSWGKIKMTANPIKVYGDASLIFPLLVAETFARNAATLAEHNSIIK